MIVDERAAQLNVLVARIYYNNFRGARAHERALIYTRADIIDAIRSPFRHYIAAVYINSPTEMIARIISSCMARVAIPASGTRGLRTALRRDSPHNNATRDRIIITPDAITMVSQSP